MVRCGVVHNIVKYVHDPTISQELLGFKPLCWHVFGTRITYYRYDRYVTWRAQSNYLGYITGSRNFRDRLSVEVSLDRYVIDNAEITFEYRPGACIINFTSRYRLTAYIEATHIRLRMGSVPFEMYKKLPRPDVKLDGSFEDAQLALKYLLDLKDQMIKLGY